jgi:hypothetical protein
MTFSQRLRIYRVGLGILILFSFHLLSDLPLLANFRDWQAREALGAEDEITAYVRRFERVRAELPERGVVGYRTQLRQKKGAETVFTYRSGKALLDLPVTESYWLAQYAVAPVIVDARGEHPLVLANLRDEVRLLRNEGQ